jgi:hypothetical protein
MNNLKVGDRVEFYRHHYGMTTGDLKYPIKGSKYYCTGEIIYIAYSHSYPVGVRWENGHQGVFYMKELRKIANRWEDILA